MTLFLARSFAVIFSEQLLQAAGGRKERVTSMLWKNRKVDLQSNRCRVCVCMHGRLFSSCGSLLSKSISDGCTVFSPGLSLEDTHTHVHTHTQRLSITQALTKNRDVPLCLLAVLSPLLLHVFGSHLFLLLCHLSFLFSVCLFFLLTHFKVVFSPAG